MSHERKRSNGRDTNVGQLELKLAACQASFPTFFTPLGEMVERLVSIDILSGRTWGWCTRAESIPYCCGYWLRELHLRTADTTSRLLHDEDDTAIKCFVFGRPSTTRCKHGHFQRDTTAVLLQVLSSFESDQVRGWYLTYPTGLSPLDAEASTNNGRGTTDLFVPFSGGAISGKSSWLCTQCTGYPAQPLQPSINPLLQPRHTRSR